MFFKLTPWLLKKNFLRYLLFKRPVLPGRDFGLLSFLQPAKPGLAVASGRVYTG